MNTVVSKRSNFGCLGCFSIICLTSVLLVELAVVWWLNPTWFDRVAFWRGPVYEPHVVLVDDPGARTRMEAQTAAIREKRTPPRTRETTPFAFGHATLDFDAENGSNLILTERASLRLPPAALDDGTEVSITPMVGVSDEMAAPFMGPVIDIKIGNQEHHRFRRPVELTLPYDGADENREPTIAGWEGGQWVARPSRIDRDQKTVTAALDHASLWAALPAGGAAVTAPVLAGGAAVTAGVVALVTSSTVRAAGYATAWSWYEHSVYETLEGNFKIHYQTSGLHAVRNDDAFRQARIPFDGSGTLGGHPLYIRYIGALLEECLKGLRKKYDLDLSDTLVIRHDVFIQNLNGAGGASELGGPLFLAPDLMSNPPADEFIRYTVAHELVHVAQDEDFNAASSGPSRWFMEIEAAYMGFRYWDDVGRPVPGVARNGLLDGRENLLLRPMDLTGWDDTTDGMMEYRYFIFPRWLDQTYGRSAGLDFLSEVSESYLGNVVDFQDFDRASRETRSGQELSDLFTDFAKDFYHDDLWTPRKKFPVIHPPGEKTSQADAQSQADNTFSRVTAQLSPEGSTALQNAWAEHQIGVDPKGGSRTMPRLSAEAVYMDAGPFPDSQKAKLVVRVDPLVKETSDLRVLIAEDRCGPAIPCQGRPGNFEALPLDFEKSTIKVVDLIGHKKGPDRVTVLAINRSLEKPVHGVKLQRWLLVPPTNVRFYRDGSSGSNFWKVEWDRIDLRFQEQVFYAYEVLRRGVGEPDSSFVPVQMTSDEDAIDQAPDRDDYVYSVRVIDRFDNRSHPALVPDRDPFVGDWFGVVREKHGLYLTKSMVQIRSVYEEKVDEARAKIQGMPESTDSERQRKREETESQEFVEELGDTAMEFAGELAPELGAVIRTAGFPAKFSIRRRDGDYYLTVKSVFGFGLNEEEFGNLPLEPAGHRALRLMQKDVPLLSKMVFHSSREDFIHARDGVVVTHKSVDTGINYDFDFSWWFYRSGVP